MVVRLGSVRVRIGGTTRGKKWNGGTVLPRSVLSAVRTSSIHRGRTCRTRQERCLLRFVVRVWDNNLAVPGEAGWTRKCV